MSLPAEERIAKLRQRLSDGQLAADAAWQQTSARLNQFAERKDSISFTLPSDDTISAAVRLLREQGVTVSATDYAASSGLPLQAKGGNLARKPSQLSNG